MHIRFFFSLILYIQPSAKSGVILDVIMYVNIFLRYDTPLHTWYVRSLGI